MPLLQVLDVTKGPPDPTGRLQWALDAPAEGLRVEGTDLGVSGWIVGRSRIDAIEILLDRHLATRAMLTGIRRDVAAKYPAFPGSLRSGFEAVVRVMGWRTVECSVWAVREDEPRHLLATFAMRRRWRENAALESTPFISVIVAAAGAHEWASATVHALTAQTYPHFEVVVVGASAASDLFPARIGNVRHVRMSGGSAASAWNRGLRASTGDFLTFLAPGEVLPSDALHFAMTEFGAHEHASVVLRDRHVPHPNGDAFGEPEHRDISNSIAVFRRSIFETVGVFGIAKTSPMQEMLARIRGRFPACVLPPPLHHR